MAPGGGVVGGGPMPAEMSQAQYFQQSQARQAAWQLQQHQRSYSMMQQQQQQQPMPQMLGSANQVCSNPIIITTWREAKERGLLAGPHDSHCTTHQKIVVSPVPMETV